MKQSSFDETIEYITKRGGGMCGVVIAKNGKFSKYFVQDFDCDTKEALISQMNDLGKIITALYDENLEPIEL